jgi:hypothetical protein
LIHLSRYLAARTDAPAKRRYLLYERALKALPGSYKVLAAGVGVVWDQQGQHQSGAATIRGSHL